VLIYKDRQKKSPIIFFKIVFCFKNLLFGNFDVWKPLGESLEHSWDSHSGELPKEKPNIGFWSFPLTVPIVDELSFTSRLAVVDV